MPQRKGGKPKKAPVEIDRLEWCFKDCPDDELLDCWQYEFAREIGWLREIVERRRKPVRLRNGQQRQIDTLTWFARQTYYSFLLRPDWPTQPYLSASRKERQRWIGWTRLQTEQEFLANSLVPTEVPKGIEEQLAGCLQNVGGPVRPRPRVRSKDNLVELALIRIDWTVPDSSLIEAFEAFIKEFRPWCRGSVDLPRGSFGSDPIWTNTIGKSATLKIAPEGLEKGVYSGRVETTRWYGSVVSPSPWNQINSALRSKLSQLQFPDFSFDRRICWNMS